MICDRFVLLPVCLSCVLAVSCECDEDCDPDEPAGEHAARCEAACSALPDTGGCSGVSDTFRTTCIEDCVTHTEGLSVLCVQCMIETAVWEACNCTCYGSECCLCCPDGCPDCRGDSNCYESFERCLGLRLGGVSADCAAQCAE